MSFASGGDLEALREVGRIVATTLEQVSHHVAPGVTTARLDRYAESILAEHGARSAPRLYYGFPGTICISVNDEIVHGVPGDREIGEGDIVKLDVTAEKSGWIADGARSILVPPVPELLSRLFECAVAALGDALGVARAGNSVRQIGRAVEDRVRRAGFNVIPELTGHGVGRSIHEWPLIPNYEDPVYDATLTEGLVVAIEPIISAGAPETLRAPDGWTVTTADRAKAAHVEETIVITTEDPIVVTELPIGKVSAGDKQ